ncbi:glycosyltransferase family 2 protein [Schaedlerella arabinosiphila]|uniref:glycosyltransferase family 2 protein n=1 Tax=Schaedlerella arabinosiphila TaxID=2044587 RepID=UPI002557E1B9|nr:glycosyltransferase family 2 protein [Schaedlerella arabinosiphila]
MKISIITISYNSKKTIEDTIRSVVSQKNDDVEYLIIDGKSTDGTLEIVDRYRDQIDVLVSEPDNGVSEAFNKGIRYSKGDVIGIINSDDLLYEGAIEKIQETFSANENLDVLFGNIRVFTENLEEGYTVKADPDLDKLRYMYLLPHPGIFIARDAYKKYGIYSTKLKNAMDYELISRMHNANAKFMYIDTVLAAFREGGISQSSLNRTIAEHRAVAKRNGGAFIEIERYLAHVYFRRKTAPLLKKLGIENKMHRMVKKS